MRRRAILLAYAATVVVFLASLVQFHHRNTGFTELIGFGDQFEKARLPAVYDAPHFVHYQSPGYDGQYYAQLAVEPLLRDPRLGIALDTASYRARRILFSWTAYLLGLGRPGWILKAYAMQNIIAWLLLAWILLRWFPPSAPRNLVPWIGCLFGVGLTYSVRFALTEGPALLLLALGVAAMERGRPWLASGLMALVGLGRETNFLAGGLLIDRLPRRWRDPAALVSLTVQAGFLLARREWGSPWWRAGAAYCALMPILSYPVWEGDPGAIMRVVLPMSVAFNVLLVRSRWFWPLVVAGNLSVLHGIHMLNVPWLAALL